MKSKLLLALVLSLTLGVAGVANGALISAVDPSAYIFNGSAITHLSFNEGLSEPYTLNSASLNISGFSVDWNNSVVSIDENIALGSLNTIYSFTNYGLTQFFRLDSGPSNGTYDVQFAIVDPNGKFAITSSTLTIDYTNNDPPISNPEPGTMMLLGSGLVGLAVWGRKKNRK